MVVVVVVVALVVLFPIISRLDELMMMMIQERGRIDFHARVLVHLQMHPLSPDTPLPLPLALAIACICRRSMLIGHYTFPAQIEISFSCTLAHTHVSGQEYCWTQWNVIYMI